MASIVPLVPADVELGPEALAAAGVAFDKARTALAGGKRPHVAEEVLARQIITLAHGGERDSERLCTRALRVFGIPLPRSAA